MTVVVVHVAVSRSSSIIDASQGIDFMMQNVPLVFNANQFGAEIRIDAFQDELIEGNESIQLTLTGDFEESPILVDINIVDTTEANGQPVIENQKFTNK